MDSEKRKRQTNGADNGRRTKARDEEEGTEKVTVTVAEKTDEEVEEFFAILRRLHSAVRDYKRDGPAGNGNGNNEPNGDVRHELWKRPSWKPSFEWGDFEGVNGAVTSRPQEEEEEGYVLDLNADPKPFQIYRADTAKWCRINRADTSKEVRLDPSIAH